MDFITRGSSAFSAPSATGCSPGAPKNASFARRLLTPATTSALLPRPMPATLPAMFAAFALLLVAVLFRVVAGFAGGNDSIWQNFSPLAAIALCGAAVLPRRVAIALPLAILFLSDVVLNVFHYHVSMLAWESVPSYFALALIAALGFALRGKANAPALLGASVAGSLLFYVLTNTGSWLGNPIYAKSFAGWLQALTVGDGIPGHPPTWWFYRHTLVSDVLFTSLFLTCMAATSRQSAPALREQPAQ